MYSSLDSIDIVTQNEETGRRSFLQTDHRPAAEIQQARELSTLFALTRVLNARDYREPQEEVDVLYVCSAPPPEFLRSVVASAGGRIQINDEPVSIYEGPIGLPEDLADDAFRRLAHRLAHERDARLDERLLEALEQEHVRLTGEGEDETGFWTRVTGLAAVAGELLRTHPGGRWARAPLIDDKPVAAIPFAFRENRQDSEGSFVNVVGKAERLPTNVERHSLVGLVRRTRENALQTEPGPVLICLKAPDWASRELTLCRPLLDSGPRALVPLMVYGHDMPSSFAIFRKDSRSQGQLEALHAQALENLKALEVEVHALEGGPRGMLIVTGTYFASEKVLDVDFLRSMHARLASRLLYAGIPRRGALLLLGDAHPESLRAFIQLCAEQYVPGDTASICRTPLLIHEGKVSGLLQVGGDEDDEDTLVPEEPQPRPGFFSRLFGRKKD